MWLELVIELNLPFTFVESRIVRKAVKYEDISVDTLQKYLELVTQSTEKKVAAALPAKFGLIIDGWSEGNQHYFGLNAAYDSDHYPLLAFAPPIDEESYSAENQAAFITDVLELFGRRRDDVLFLVADNTNVNPATARLLGCSFIGCASHRFNLAVKEYMLTYEEKLDDIQSLMKKLLNLKIAGALRRKTDLKPVIRNVTRWSSTYSMLKRFLQLKDILVSLNHPEVNEFLPDGRQVNSLEALEKNLKVLESVTKALQNSRVNLAQVRLLFEKISVKYPTLRGRLRTNAALVFCEDFENGIVKIIDGKEEHLTEEEKGKVAVFLKESVTENSDAREEDDGVEKDFARTLLEWNEKCKESATSKYVDLNWVPPTSNVVERLFSAARQKLTDYRKSMSPYTFECVMFLKVNRKYWDIDLVNEVFWYLLRLFHRSEIGKNREIGHHYGGNISKIGRYLWSIINTLP